MPARRAAAAGLEVAHARFGGGDPRLIALDRERRFAEIEPDENVPGPDPVALAHPDLDDPARHLRRKVDHRRLDASVQTNDVRVLGLAAGGEREAEAQE